MLYQFSLRLFPLADKLGNVCGVRPRTRERMATATAQLSFRSRS